MELHLSSDSRPQPGTQGACRGRVTAILAVFGKGKRSREKITVRAKASRAETQRRRGRIENKGVTYCKSLRLSVSPPVCLFFHTFRCPCHSRTRAGCPPRGRSDGRRKKSDKILRSDYRGPLARDTSPRVPGMLGGTKREHHGHAGRSQWGHHPWRFRHYLQP